MSQNLDIKKICKLIQNTRSQNILFQTINTLNKESKRRAIEEFNKFTTNNDCYFIVIKK
jgi:hypothetical protein